MEAARFLPEARSTGERVWVAWTNRAICDETGFPVGVVSVGTDTSG